MHEYNETFSRVTVDCIIVGGTRVSWEMNRHFIDPGPYTFQLQVGHTGINEADDWTDVGSPVVDTYFTFDTEKRVYGKTQETHYRVELTTGLDTYYSEPADCDGHLQKRDWLNGREIVRKEFLRHRVLTSPEGFLLKARRYGPRCPTCLDEFTEEVGRTNCEDCYGTGFENGYFDPLPACFADISEDTGREHRDANIGMENKQVIKGRFIGDPQLYSYDVWVDKTSGKRYYIHCVNTVSQVRGVAIIYDAELRLAPFSDVIYTVPISTGFSAPRTKQIKPAVKQWTTPVKTDLNYMELVLRQAKQKTRSSKR